MQWVRQTVSRLKSKSALKKIVAIFLFIFVYYLSHIYYLGTNELNPDAVNWHKRSEQFVLAFKLKDFAKTNQHYHPGVTLMWIIGPSVEAVKQLTNSRVVYSSDNYEAFHFASKSSLLFVNLLLSLFLIYVLGKIIGFWKSLAIVTVMNIEPFFLGNSRVLHMDILFTNLVAVGLSTAFYTFRTLKYRFLLLSGFFAAMTVLTRSVGIGLIVYNLAFFIYTAIITRTKKLALFGGVFLVSVMVTCFILFPALWVKPIKTIDKIFSRSYQVGVEYGHNQIFMGQFTEDPGLAFYPFAFLLKMSPFILVGVLLAVIFGVSMLRKSNLKSTWKQTFRCQNNLSFLLFLSVFYLGYFLILNTSNKKVDRYILPMYFLFSYLAVYGYYYLFRAFDHISVKLAVFALFVLSVLYPIYKFAPYEFLYYSPIFKSSNFANNMISQKNFGMGIFHLQKFLDARYGCVQSDGNYPKNFKPVLYGDSYICPKDDDNVNIGMSDTKAMKEIHGNSNTTDFRFNSPSLYDVLVLAIDEDMPKEVLEEGAKYNMESSVFVNDVELWRIYVRQN